MARKKSAKKDTIKNKLIPTQRSPRKSPAGSNARGKAETRNKYPPRATDETLGEGWKVGDIAWNDSGNIVILEPALAELLRKKALKDREFQMGIPRKPTRVKRGAGGGARYDPYPLEDPPQIGKRFRPPLELCVCNYLQFLLIKEAPVQVMPLSEKPALLMGG